MEKQINTLKKQLRDYPEGKLLCCRNGKYVKWYLSNGSKPIHISKKETEFIQKLAEKKYIQYRLKDLESEKKAIESYLRHHKEGIGRAEQLLIDYPEIFDLLSDKFKPMSHKLQEWIKTPYIKNEKYVEQLNISTSAGVKVRSKSEALIVSVLHKSNIPFRYECRMTLKGIEIFPDFTIKHPKTGKIILWEHFGMMDDEKYRNNVVSKLQLYISNGFIPTIDIITTYETKKHPIDVEEIERIVEQYFLS